MKTVEPRSVSRGIPARPTVTKKSVAPKKRTGKREQSEAEKHLSRTLREKRDQLRLQELAEDDLDDVKD